MESTELNAELTVTFCSHSSGLWQFLYSVFVKKQQKKQTEFSENHVD